MCTYHNGNILGIFEFRILMHTYDNVYIQYSCIPMYGSISALHRGKMVHR
jgi:hypothetical protein